MLLFITMLLCGVQPVYSMEVEQEPEKPLKKFTFDEAEFLESNQPVKQFPDSKIARRLAKIKSFYPKRIIPNRELNAIGHSRLNDPGAKIQMWKSNVTVMQTITEADPVDVLTIDYAHGEHKIKTIAPSRKKTYEILIPDNQNP